MKVIVIGAGLSGLTAATLLAKEGHSVELFEQYDRVGGVTAGIEKAGFKWDLGQMLIPDLSEGEPGRKVLEKLGISKKVKVVKSYRENYFPDFTISKPIKYEGRRWRINYLKSLFPNDANGLDKYMKIYELIHDLSALALKNGVINKLKLIFKSLKIIRKKNWSAQKLMDHCFNSKELQAVFIAILADYVISPKDFPGLIIPILNQESQYDDRVPLDYENHEHRGSWTYIIGGCMHLSKSIAESYKENGGKLHLNTLIEKIKIVNNTVRKVIDVNGKKYEADVVVASGGARELFSDIIGKDHTPQDYINKYLSNLYTTESIFMVHLGVDYDPSKFQNGAITCYYYLSYEIDDSIQNCIQGNYHEGEHGFVVYIPSKHSPEMAPPEHHSITIYTIAPNKPEGIDWEQDKENLAEKLLDIAEEHIPGLREHEKTRVILTPGDFRKLTNLKNHAFGGTVPHLNFPPPPHKTPIEGLWFIGAQSENFGGVTGAMTGADAIVKEILKDYDN